MRVDPIVALATGSLDAQCWQFEVFTDLLGYLSWRSAADRRAQDEARIVGAVGAWIEAEAFGPVA
jgi:hypothetical protein